MSKANQYPPDVETLPAASSRGAAPAAHEDLTIAEHLELMRVHDEHRPGEVCFLNTRGEKRWVAASEVNRFIRRVGALHPSDYEAANGSDWTLNFFSGF